MTTVLFPRIFEFVDVGTFLVICLYHYFLAFGAYLMHFSIIFAPILLILNLPF